MVPIGTALEDALCELPNWRATGSTLFPHDSASMLYRYVAVAACSGSRYCLPAFLFHISL